MERIITKLDDGWSRVSLIFESEQEVHSYACGVTPVGSVEASAPRAAQ